MRICNIFPPNPAHSAQKARVECPGQRAGWSNGITIPTLPEENLAQPHLQPQTILPHGICCDFLDDLQEIEFCMTDLNLMFNKIKSLQQEETQSLSDGTGKLQLQLKLFILPGGFLKEIRLGSLSKHSIKPNKKSIYTNLHRDSHA